MSEQQKEMVTEVPLTTSQRPNMTLIFTVVLPIVCAIVGYLAPSPYKQWGLAGLLISLGSLLLFRTIQQFLNTARAKASLPYSVATFLVLIPFAIWGTGIYQRIALIVFLAIAGIATFYSIVRITVDEFKKGFLRR